MWRPATPDGYRVGRLAPPDDGFVVEHDGRLIEIRDRAGGLARLSAKEAAEVVEWDRRRRAAVFDRRVRRALGAFGSAPPRDRWMAGC